MQFRNICIIISTFNILSNCLILSTLPCDLKVSLRTYIFKILPFIFSLRSKKFHLFIWIDTLQSTTIILRIIILTNILNKNLLVIHLDDGYDASVEKF